MVQTDPVAYEVLENDEEQYAAWPSDREVPLGWTPIGITGTLDQCLEWIKEHWTDMRPLSLRTNTDSGN